MTASLKRIAFLLLATGWAWLGHPASAAEPRPNVVLIVADDLGYGDLGCYGSKRHVTPNLDALAAGGVRFTQFRVSPLCAPTRASILTGLYSLETGMWRGPSQAGGNDEEEGEKAGGRPRPSREGRERRPRTEGDATKTNTRELHADLRLLPQCLREAGYATGMFGKWHLGYDAPNVPNGRGFDEFVGFLGGTHPYDTQRGEPIRRNSTPIMDGRHLTDLFTDEAVAFIEAHRDVSFFCYLPYNAVHGPLWAPDRQTASAPQEWLRKAAARGLDFPQRDYSATLEQMDAGVGRITEALRRLGLEERTLVVFVSDNGALEEQYSGDNGPLRGQKGQTYEGGIRVPALMRWPGVIPEGVVSDAPAMAFDLFATILDAVGADVPQKNGNRAVSGVSLLGHVRSGGTAPLPDRYLFWDLYGKLGAYHDGWKLVGNIKNHRGRFAKAVPQIEAAAMELYYLPDDVGEERDLSRTKPEVYAELKGRLVEWFRESTR